MEQLLAALGNQGIRLALDGAELRVTAPQGALTAELRAALSLHKAALIDMLGAQRALADADAPKVVADLAARHSPFPLTELQHAYWLGRNRALDPGAVATHLYVELDCAPLELPRLEDALNQLIRRHDMLRAVVDGDGMQRILADVPHYAIAVRDVSGAAASDAEVAIVEQREALSHQVFDASRWPIFEVRATPLPWQRLRLHVSLDLLILDAWSIFLFFSEWHRRYEAPDAPLVPPGISFRDTALAERAREQTAAWRRSWDWWMARVDALPPAPDLPLRADRAARSQLRFSRREHSLDGVTWNRIKARARDRGLTPSGLLLAAYSEVLARWSASAQFTVNVTLGNRQPVHADVHQLLGDFTTLVMQGVDRRDNGASFTDFARDLQRDFLASVDNSQVSGVTVMREWARRRGQSMQATMPVVFSSGLVWSGDQEVGDLEQFGSKIYSVSQTSQVWLDHHVMEIKGRLVLIWDAADAVFEDGVLDAMFAAYCKLVEALDDDAGVWLARDPVALPVEIQRRRDQLDATATPVRDERIHAGFVGWALRNPGAPAVHCTTRTLTAGQLLGEAAALADQLRGGGLQPAQPVAVVMRKGWEQIVAVFGVLLAGGAYLPIDADLPARRQAELLALSGVAQVLTQPGGLRGEAARGPWQEIQVHAGVTAPFGPAHAATLAAPTDELAYVIFTSGTTGVPKGVMIDHAGAVNTLHAINRMFAVGPQTRVLGVSSLSFDLSVYDIFGVLGAGGTLVLPDGARGNDGAHWRELIERWGITLWNSAPQLMRMVCDSFGARELGGETLRSVLLSGDFIPLDLPDTVRMRYANASVTSLGGATEASIWSIAHPVDRVDPRAASIPYGRPLPNQTVAVLDSALRPCPDHVRGRIYIGGAGLALGYWGDEEKTRQRFIRHPATGARLYDTGDLGRHSPDGAVVILGRDDGQIKIRGHRVELGEIDAVLRRYPAVQQAVVIATAGPGESRQLAGYVQLVAGAAPAETIAALRAFAAERLPDYMVPRHLVAIDALPLSGNGKVDVARLPAPDDSAMDATPSVAPRNAIETTILDAWQRVIPGIDIGVTDNFFDLGGDSILATQLVREINAALGFELEMHELFENLTIEALAALFSARQAGNEAAEQGGLASAATLLADLDQVRERLASLRPQRRAPLPRREVLLTGATGWIGAHLLAELLATDVARVHCLVRADDDAAALQRLRATLAAHRIHVDASAWTRVDAFAGDLTAPRFGLAQDAWQQLGERLDAIYHLAASVNVTLDYASHRRSNVLPLPAVVELAALDHAKALVCVSPLAVARRRRDGVLTVLADEAVHPDPAGLLTAYAQSKWVAEQILAEARAWGLPVTLYRSSHALPNAASGWGKPHDTYGRVLQMACHVDALPDWDASRLPGLPVDLLCRLIVEDSARDDADRFVVHLENRAPASFGAVIAELMTEKHGMAGAVPTLAFDDWKARCLDLANHLPDEEATLVKLLFSTRNGAAAIENMFSADAIATGYFERSGRAAALIGATPPDYWRRVFAASRDNAAVHGDAAERMEQAS